MDSATKERAGPRPAGRGNRWEKLVEAGLLSADALAHYRTGLTALVRALPADMEVTLITMSPQPMMVVRPTTDRIRLLRGVNGFAPQEESPRFTDTLVEFSRRCRL